MVCFIDTYWPCYTEEGVKLLPPSTYDPYWVTCVHRFGDYGDYYSCSYGYRYPWSQS